MLSPPFKNLSIIGLGLIGGSLAMAARSAYPDLVIRGFDTNSEVLQFALKNNVIDEASLDPPGAFADNHLVVLSCHLKASHQALKDIAPLIKDKDVMVMDVGSCKRQIVALGKDLLPTQFIGGHPMAGKEFSGVKHATSLLFAGKSFIFCPHDQTDEARFERLKQFVQGLKALPRSLDPDKHDQYMAYVSHLPQLYSVLLTNLIHHREPGHLLSFHGGGIDDQLRLAASPHAMWGDVFDENKDNLKKVLQELIEIAGDAKGVLGEEALGEWFKRSNELHREFHLRLLNQ